MWPLTLRVRVGRPYCPRRLTYPILIYMQHFHLQDYNWWPQNNPKTQSLTMRKLWTVSTCSFKIGINTSVIWRSKGAVIIYGWEHKDLENMMEWLKFISITYQTSPFPCLKYITVLANRQSTIITKYVIIIFTKWVIVLHICLIMEHMSFYFYNHYW